MGKRSKRQRKKKSKTVHRLTLLKPRLLMTLAVAVAILADGCSASTGLTVNVDRIKYGSDDLYQFYQGQSYKNNPLDFPFPTNEHYSSYDHPPFDTIIPSYHHNFSNKIWMSDNVPSFSHNFPLSEDHFDTSYRMSETRIKRNPNDKSTEYLNHATIIAHISNGIALQTGLMDGKIPIDEVVGELLNFGSVKVSDVAEFKSDKINALTTQMKGIQSSLDSSVIDAEDAALKWNQLLIDSESVGDVKDTTQTDSYFTQVEDFEKNFKLKPLKDIETNLESLSKKVDKINELDVNMPSQDRSQAAALFKSLSMTFEIVVKDLKKLKDPSKNLDSYHLLSNGPTIFEPLEKMVHLIVQRNGTKYTPKNNDIDVLRRNLGKTIGLVTASKASDQDIMNINSLAAARVNPTMTKRKYTNGFPNGITDVKQFMKDVRDPWIGKITGIEGTKLNRLGDGLQPLFKVKDRLSKMNDKLEPITSTNAQSLSSVHQLQQGISLLSTDAVDSVQVFNGFHTCSSTIRGKYIKNAQLVINHVEKVRSGLSKLKKAIEATKVDEMEKEKNDFFKDLGFSDIMSTDKSENYVVEALEKLEKTGGLKRIRKYVSGIKEKFDAVNINELTSTVWDNLETNGKKDVEGLRGELDIELKVHKCIRNLKDTSGKLSHAIKMTQKLRSLNTKEISDVDEIISAVSKTSKDLIDIKSIPTSMEKSDMINELNKMPNSMENSVSIGQSVNSLQSAYRLKELESSIDELKQIGSIVNDAIYSISNPFERRTILSDWGDHNKEMIELDNALIQIKTFDSKIDVSKAKTIGEYGNPLKELIQITDVNIDLMKKSKALDSLIQLVTDTNVKKNLEMSKDTLNKLSTLDLQFSSHTTQFQQAPSAFKALHDFLTQLFNIDSSTQTQNPNDEGGGFPWMYVIYGVAAVLTIAAFVFIGICYKRSQRIKKKGGKSYAWIDGQKYVNAEDARAFHEGVYTTISALDEDRVEDRSYDFVEQKKHRYNNVYCNPETGVRVFKNESEEVHIHGNHILMKNRRYIATQGPLDGTERGHKRDTRTDFWAMVWDNYAEFIVMLCAFEEPEQGGMSKKCAVYFAEKAGDEMTFDQINQKKYTVKTRTVTSILNGRGCKRVLDVYNEEGKKRTVTHLQYTGWPDMRAPDTPDDVYELHKMLKTEKPIVTHCSSGVGRTVAFIAVDYICEEVKRDPSSQFSSMMVHLRNQRWHGIQNPVQSYFVQVAAVLKLTNENKLKKERYENLLRMYQDVKEIWHPNTLPAVDEEAPARNQGGREEAVTSSSESSVDSTVSAESDNYDSDLEEVDHANLEQRGQEEANAENERPNQVIIPINDEANAGQEQGEEGGQEAANDRERPPHIAIQMGEN